MNYSDDLLSRIWEKTDGRCHLCGLKLTFRSYSCLGERGAWEVDHSNAWANGGFDWLGNFLPAHISCNRSKGARSNKSVRSRYGITRKPLSKIQKQRLSDLEDWKGLLALWGILGGIWLYNKYREQRRITNPINLSQQSQVRFFS